MSGFTAEPRSISQRPHQIPRPSNPSDIVGHERDDGVCSFLRNAELLVSGSAQRVVRFRALNGEAGHAFYFPRMSHEPSWICMFVEASALRANTPCRLTA
jgi:hypothetical protein